MYKDDMRHIIDEKLDCITRFEDTDINGARLSWFDNCGFRDVKLTYRLREITVYTINGKTELLPGILIKAKHDLLSHVRSVASMREENKRIAENQQFDR